MEYISLNMAEGNYRKDKILLVILNVPQNYMSSEIATFCSI